MHREATTENLTETVYITELEKQLLFDLSKTDHSSDGEGFSMYIGDGWESMPMTQARAIISSLKQKGILVFSPASYGFPAHISPKQKFVEQSDQFYGEGHERDACPFIDGKYGYRYVNLSLR